MVEQNKEGTKAGETIRFINQSSFPDSIEFIAQSGERKKSEWLSNKLKEFEHEVSPKVVHENESVIRSLSERSAKYGLYLSPPEIHYIDTSERGRVNKMIFYSGFANIPDSTVAGFALTSNIVVFTEAGMLDLDLAKITRHELGHLYRMKKMKLRNYESVTAVKDYMDGANISTETSKRVGHLFEEGFVCAEVENYHNLRGKQLFPSDYEEKMKKISIWMDTAGKIFGQPPKYASTWLITKNNVFLNIEGDGMIELHKKVEEKIPDWMEIVAKARLTGKWDEVREKTDSKLGSGVFSSLFSLSKNDFKKQITPYLILMVEGKLKPQAAKNAFSEIG